MPKFDLERQFKEDTYTIAMELDPSQCKMPQWHEELQALLDSGQRSMRVMDSSAGVSKLVGGRTWHTPTTFGQSQYITMAAALVMSVPKANPGITIDRTSDMSEYNPTDVGALASRIDVSKCSVMLMGDGMHSWQVVPAAQAADVIARQQKDLMRLDHVLRMSSPEERANFQIHGNSEQTMAARRLFGDNGIYSNPPREGHMGAFDALVKGLMQLPLDLKALEAIGNAEDRYRAAYQHEMKFFPKSPAYVQAYALHQSVETLSAQLQSNNPLVQDTLKQLMAQTFNNMNYMRYEHDGRPRTEMPMHVHSSQDLSGGPEVEDDGHDEHDD